MIQSFNKNNLHYLRLFKMNFLSTNKFQLIQAEIDAISTISQDDKDKV